VDGVGHGRSYSGPFHALIVVEGSPLRPLVDEILVDDQAAIRTDQLGALIVAHEGVALALRTLNSELLELVYLLFLALEPGPFLELFRLYPLYLSQLLNLFHLLSLPGASSI
jgi:hypothetical protein